MSTAQGEQGTLDIPDQNIRYINLDDLELDPENPRFGSQESRHQSQTDILNNIVETFKIEDLLSSISVNGFFDSEPLICISSTNKGKYTVVEGNRRLAACLILKGDKRAKAQIRRTESFSKLWKSHGEKRYNPVPVIIFENGRHDKQLLSYLGVRHIAGSHLWDSYAKASWIADVIESSDMTLSEVVAMIGDNTNTAVRMVEGYYLVKQLQDKGVFNPGLSMRKGRGSAALYPFSWVYTLVGYGAVREFLEIPDGEPRPNFLSETKFDDAALLLDAMFGNKGKNQQPLIRESRELGALARITSKEATVAQLRSGKYVRDIEADFLPVEKRLFTAVVKAKGNLSEVQNLLSTENITVDVAENLRDYTNMVRKLGRDIHGKLNEIISGLDDDL